MQINLPFVSGVALQKYLRAEEGIVEAQRNNCSHWYIDGSLSTEVPSMWDGKRIEGLQRLIEQCNVKPIFHGNYKVPLASDVSELRQTAIEYVKKEIDFCSNFGAPLIVHAGVIVEPRLVTRVKQKALNDFVSSLKELMDYSSLKKVEIYVENLSNYKNYRPFHYIFTYEEEFDYVLSAIHDLKLFFDVGHGNVCDGQPAKVIKRFSDRIVGMSFSNNDGIRDQHLSINRGTIDYKKIISTILACKWCGILGFEVRDYSVMDGLRDIEKIYAASCIGHPV